MINKTNLGILTNSHNDIVRKAIWSTIHQDVGRNDDERQFAERPGLDAYEMARSLKTGQSSMDFPTLCSLATRSRRPVSEVS